MKKSCLLFTFILLLFSVQPGFAVPTQSGTTGLLTQPTAETLNAGNICIGGWGDYSSSATGDATVVPVSITLGLGSFLEFYGNYPNLLFNDDEIASGHGYATLGGKIRILGKRSSPFKLALDGQAQRYISNDLARDGLMDYMARAVASLKLKRIGVHVNGGYIFPEDPVGIDFKEQTVVGGGIEIYPTTRLRLIAEAEMKSKRLEGVDESLETTVGFQYFVSPHLTLNLGAGFGMTDASPDWRALIGITACQGIGSYQKSIPKIVEPVVEETVEEAPKKVVKIRTLTPLVPVASKPVKVAPPSPVSKLEVAVEPHQEEVTVMPSEQLTLAAGPDVKALAAVPAGSPVEIASQDPIKTVVYRKFRLPEVTFGFDQWSLTPAGERALSEIAEQLRRDNKWFVIRLDGHTDSTGSERYNEKLSLDRAVSTASHFVLKDGFDPRRIFVKGFGESKPVATNATAEGRSENRRVEILVLVRKESL